MDQSLDIRVGSSLLSDSHWHSNVGFLELRLLLVIDLTADAVDNYVLVSNDVRKLFLVSEVV